MEKCARRKINKATQLKYAMRTIENSPDGVYWSDADGAIVYVNQAACNQLGYTREELLNMTIMDIDKRFKPGDIGKDGKFIRAAQAGEFVRLQTSHTHKDGHTIPIGITLGTLEVGRNALGFSFVRDISAQLEEQNKLMRAYSELEEKNAELNLLNRRLASREAQLEYLAYHDTLTGLPNRALLLSDLDAMTQSLQTNEKIMMFFIDLDNFKFINDNFGHSKGDEVLREVSVRARRQLEQPQRLYRIGGDEFIALIPGAWSSGEIDAFARSMMACLSLPVILDSFPLSLSCSVGIAVCPDHAATPDDLLKYSDAAMYNAKVSGKNRYCVFSEDIKSEYARQLERIG